MYGEESVQLFAQYYSGNQEVGGKKVPDLSGWSRGGFKNDRNCQMERKNEGQDSMETNKRENTEMTEIDPPQKAFMWRKPTIY